MSLNENRTTFTFNHAGQVDEYGADVGNYATVQENFDSRAEENLADINNIKTTLISETVDDSGAHNVKSAGITGILSGAAASIYAMLSALKGYVDTAQMGQIPDGSLEDAKLSDTAGQIKDTVAVHLAETTPHTTTSDNTIYVNTSTGNDTTGNGSVGNPYQTITKALSTLKQTINHNITVNIAAGAYNENVQIYGFTGKGNLNILSAAGSVLSNDYTVNYVDVKKCSLPIQITGLKAISTVDSYIIESSQDVLISFCKTIETSANNGVIIRSSLARVVNCEISNKFRAIYATNCSIVLSENNTGTGNTNGLVAIGTSTIGKLGTQANATTAEVTASGGVTR
jgi:hypothetical protein